MKTSYFAKYKGDNGVSIAQITPSWYIGKEYKKLAPKYWILRKYKKGEIDEEQYIELFYKNILSKLDATTVYNELKSLTGSDDIVLLCYEKSDKFCHRHIVAKWFKEELGIDILELI